MITVYVVHVQKNRRISLWKKKFYAICREIYNLSRYLHVVQDVPANILQTSRGRRVYLDELESHRNDGPEKGIMCKFMIGEMNPEGLYHGSPNIFDHRLPLLRKYVYIIRLSTPI